ncbi:MAG TPA: DUF742 domain-containing protein [Amycolatopsis sp.]|uniref:DUF742 domain-containing protein n=1 Tax=Amycolatopsis sp. TaxID=37632 RepID=UPI002B490E53|nr:DUF742 domain-containing protein [Amycolatopsis sp.]HKS46922.1 DUF742 domain-containing protein [Amycolatopsis sp.]
MPDVGDDPCFDDAAGRLIRPYTVSGGRTRPKSHFDLMTMVLTTGTVARNELEPDHAQVLELCEKPMTVAEIAARLRMPVTVTKVLLSDLMEHGAVVTRTIELPSAGDYLVNLGTLEAVLDGLRKRL